mmetsp:Transcript_11020/g.15208  ORF Transcript_11020/g.15208 Transcript_11020/m.15208 type:complete len:144 (-) Transcript_11020:216-647(-)
MTESNSFQRKPLGDRTNELDSFIISKNVEGSEVEFDVKFGPGPLGIEFQPENCDIGCRVLRLHELFGQEAEVQADARSLVRPGDCMKSVDGQQVRDISFADIVNILRGRCQSIRTVRFIRTVANKLMESPKKEIAPKKTSTWP